MISSVVANEAEIAQIEKVVREDDCCNECQKYRLYRMPMKCAEVRHQRGL